MGMLYRIRYIDQMGTSIVRMRKAARGTNVAESEFELSGFFKAAFKRNEVDALSGRNRMHCPVEYR